MLMPHVSEAIRNETINMMQKHPECLSLSPVDIFKLAFSKQNAIPEDEEDEWCLNHIRENSEHAIKVIAAAMGMM